MPTSAARFVPFRTVLSHLLLPLALAALRGGAAELSFADAHVRGKLGRECPVVYLWPEGKVPDEPRPIPAEAVQPSKNVPDILMVHNVTRPSMTIIAPPPEKSTGVALIVGPGGGYGGLAYRDGLALAEVLNPQGIAVVLLKYRVPQRNEGFPMHHQPLQDAQRALGLLRARGREWGIAPDKIGIAGVSAGGHLAAALSNHHARRIYPRVDEHDDVSCRPDFAVLLCPAYLTDPIDSRTPDPKLAYPEITAAKVPPTFITITMPDRFLTGVTEYALALVRAKVNSELHVYPTGGHATGVTREWLAAWTPECVRWLGDLGLLGARSKPVAATFKARSLPAAPAPPGLTEGDWKIRQVAGRDLPVIPLWPNGSGPDDPSPAAGGEVVAPKSRGGVALNITQVIRPTLTVFAPPAGRANGQAVIVLPGGAYSALAAEHEGVAVAEWLNTQGIAAFVLKYRVPARAGFARHHHAVQDAQRAVRLVRSRAAEWGIDPQRIGALGFSAGGHAVTALATGHARAAYAAVDAIDRVSARPDFVLPIYPAYLTETMESDTVIEDLKAGLQRESTPPLFFAIARDDRFARGLLNFYLEVRTAQVPAEMHVYHSGGHGGGIDPGSYPASEWIKPAARWLAERRAN
jgi:acetyl esterase/lipase